MYQSHDMCSGRRHDIPRCIRGRATIHFESQQTDLPGNAQTSLCPFLLGITCERERNLEWITIPATGEEAEVTHGFSMSRLFAQAGTVVEGGELKTGEHFKMRMSDGYIGTSWWCWGDLEGGLKDKPFHAWQKGINFLDAPFPADRDNWALGEDPSELKFEDHSGWVEFRVVE